MARGPLTKYEHPELPNALGWLRGRVRMTQSEVAQAAGITSVYYSQLERGAVNSEGSAKYPSVSALQSVLQALSSDMDELDGLLAHKPWVDTPETLRRASRMNRASPRPALYGEVKLASAPAATTRTPPSPDDTQSATTAIRGVIAEASDILSQVSEQERITALAYLRSLDPRRRPR
ncbi:MAG: helix-turn-helix domain-containing protein [Solirubrobacteraceae bacterium]